MDRFRFTRAALTDPTLAERLHRVLLGVVLALGALDTVYLRQWNLNPDGVSYVDLARAFAAHGPLALINGYWSPLYPALLGSAFALIRPSHATAYPMVRAIGFGIFVLAAFAFARLLRLVLESPQVAIRPVDRLLAIVIGWEIFAVLVLKGIGLFFVTPDIGVAAVVFWVSAELIVLTQRPFTRARWIRMGALLAIGYWWKAILFPVSGVVLIVAATIAIRRRDGWRGPMAACAAFLALALVLMIPVSRATGRLTFGETGRLNQLWFVAGAPQIVDACQPGQPSAAMRNGIQLDSVINERPLTCVLPDRWAESTLPLWYDPSRWYKDRHSPLHLERSWAAVHTNLGYLRESLGDAAPWLSVALFGAALATLLARSSMNRMVPLVVIAAASIGFYLIVYVELRHVVPFLIVASLVVLSTLLLRISRWRVVTLVILAICGAVDVVNHVSEPILVELSILRHEIRGDPRPLQTSDRVARLLHDRGLVEGDRFVTVNALWNIDWAQRAGYVVRAYTPEYTVGFTQTFRELRDPCRRAVWEQHLASARIDAAVIFVPNGFVAPGGFQALDDTGYYVMRIVRRPLRDGCRVS